VFANELDERLVTDTLLDRVDLDGELKRLVPGEPPCLATMTVRTFKAFRVPRVCSEPSTHAAVDFAVSGGSAIRMSVSISVGYTHIPT
jgi:hypothetical protein